MTIDINGTEYSFAVERQSARAGKEEIVDLTCSYNGRSCLITGLAKDVKKSRLGFVKQLLDRFKQDPDLPDGDYEKLEEVIPEVAELLK